MSDILWNNELERKLLVCYQAEPVLWQPKHKHHKSKCKVHDAWVRISETMDIPVIDLKKKKDSLMSSYRSYKKKVRDSLISEDSSEVYKPRWFAFDLIESFLGDREQSNETINTFQEVLTLVYENEDEAESPVENVESQRTTPPPPTVRRRKMPAGFVSASEVVKEAVTTPKVTIDTPRIEREDDECDLHGKIIAKKLRQLPENERLKFVCDIYQMFVQREQLKNGPQSTQCSDQ